MNRLTLAFMLAFVSSMPASATVVTMEFAGIFTNTTDTTGTVFRNGTHANSGVGTTVTGKIVWDIEPGSTFGPAGFDAYQYDVGTTECCYRDPALDPIHWSVSISGNEYNSELNYGSDNLMYLADHESGALPDDYLTVWLHSFGHYQLTPAVSGVYDYLSVSRFLDLHITDPSGNFVQVADFTHPFDWVSGANGFGTGRVLLDSRLWFDGGTRNGTGIPGDYLSNAAGNFALTSLHSSVPEPESFALFFSGLVGLLFVRRRKVSANAANRTVEF